MAQMAQMKKPFRPNRLPPERAPEPSSWTDPRASLSAESAPSADDPLRFWSPRCSLSLMESVAFAQVVLAEVGFHFSQDPIHRGNESLAALGVAAHGDHRVPLR